MVLLINGWAKPPWVADSNVLVLDGLLYLNFTMTITVLENSGHNDHRGVFLIRIG